MDRKEQGLWDACYHLAFLFDALAFNTRSCIIAQQSLNFPIFLFQLSGHVGYRQCQCAQLWGRFKGGEAVGVPYRGN